MYKNRKIEKKGGRLDGKPSSSKEECGMRRFIGSSTSHDNKRVLLTHYTKQLASHVNNDRHHQALSLFSFLYSSPHLVNLDPFVFPLTLKSCTALRLPRPIQSIHAHTIITNFNSNPFVASSLVDAYGKCVSLHSARLLFDECSQRNVVVWNAIISLYSRSNKVSTAIGLFDSMDVEPNSSTYNSIIAGLLDCPDGGGTSVANRFYRKMIASGVRPNLITLLALLPACCLDLNRVREIHGFSVRSFIDGDLQLSSGLVEAYGKCGGLRHAGEVFGRMSVRDVVAWSSMISAYALNGEAGLAMDTFCRMETANVKPDSIMFLAVLKACSHAGLTEDALEYFELMSKSYGLEAGSDHYACLVDVLSRAGRLSEAYGMIRGMPVSATAKAWGALLGACRSYGNVELAETAGRKLFELEPDNAGNFVILANIYASAGRFEEAESVRKETKERFVNRAPGSSWFLVSN